MHFFVFQMFGDDVKIKTARYLNDKRGNTHHNTLNGLHIVSYRMGT